MSGEMFTILIFVHYIVFDCSIIDAKHFNGGTIRWEPISPSINSSQIPITITQSYSWAFPRITCATNVPISTAGRSGENSNLVCVTDCSTDGGYSTKPVDILTDCVSSSSSLGMMQSQRAVNISLGNGAHFYLSHRGSAWGELNDPPTKSLPWTLTTFIDLRFRSDGLINTPPVASVVSPQYAIVNTPTKIKIPVSDDNLGDDVRCRWATYTSGINRKRRSIDGITTTGQPSSRRYKRYDCGGKCKHKCAKDCWCSCDACEDTTCTGYKCPTEPCPVTAGTAPPKTTTLETPGTVASTISYRVRQAIDECGGICYPASLPSGTSLSNCTISFTGLVPGRWYGVAVQVEDFINKTSTKPMSSVPVQFLIYVMPAPLCPKPPVIVPLNICMEVLIGVPRSFTIRIINLCDPDDASVEDLIQTSPITGMQAGPLTQLSSNTSIFSVTFTWTPVANQNGSQPWCLMAFTDEKVQSAQYCTNFEVVSILNVCKPTTTTSTTTTTTTTTTKTTSSSSTSTTSTSTSTTSVTTTTSTTSTSTTSTTTSTTSTTTTTTSTTSTTSTTTTTTTTTSTTSTSTTTTTATTTKRPINPPHWLLIFGLSLLSLLMALCCCCCWYWYLCGAGAKHRRERKEKKHSIDQFLTIERERQSKIIPLYHPNTSLYSTTSDQTTTGNISATALIQNDDTSINNGKDQVTVTRISKIDKPLEVGNPRIQLLDNQNIEENTNQVCLSTSPVSLEAIDGIIKQDRSSRLDESDQLSVDQKSSNQSITTVRVRKVKKPTMEGLKVIEHDSNHVDGRVSVIRVRK